MKKHLTQIFLLLLFLTPQLKSQEIFVFNELNSPLRTDGFLLCIAVDSNNTIWVGGKDGAYFYDQDSWDFIAQNLDLSIAPFSARSISDLEVSPDGNIYITIYDSQHNTDIIYKLEDSEFNGYGYGPVGLRNPVSMSIENDSTILLSLWNFWPHQWGQDAIGLLKGENFKLIDRPEFAHDLNSAVLVNNDSTIIASFWSQLFIHSNNIWQEITPENWGEYDRFYIYKFNDEIFLFGDRLIKYADGLFFEYSEINAILEADSSKITSIKAESANRFWLGTDKGLLIKYDETKLTLFNEITGFEIIELAIDKDKNIWLIADGLGCVVFYEDQIVAVEQSKQIVPEDFELFQNYPNPFNPTTKIKFTIPNFVISPRGRNLGDFSSSSTSRNDNRNVVLKIYDILGNEITTLVKEQKSPGTYEVEFNGESVGRRITSGIYFYKLSVGKYSETRKMLLMK